MPQMLKNASKTNARDFSFIANDIHARTQKFSNVLTQQPFEDRVSVFSRKIYNQRHLVITHISSYALLCAVTCLILCASVHARQCACVYNIPQVY